MEKNPLKQCKQQRQRCDPCSEIFSALSCPQRLKIVRILSQGNICVKDLAEQMEIDVSVVSRHLKSLKTSGLVQSNRIGVNTYYEIEDTRVLDLLDTASVILKDRAMNMLYNE
ncbi:MAG: metalloregulator ArsR/SmtB family transcription factor [Thermodesulfobacteriota bacterium]|nr:metalloregulator ArsR/SmtB family transcription factor [Thermodesulfobacteriota bacterium]